MDSTNLKSKLIDGKKVTIALRTEDGEWIFMPLARVCVEADVIELDCHWKDRS